MAAASQAPPRRRPQEWVAPLASSAHAGPQAGELARIAGKVEDGTCLSAAEALALHERADLLLLMRLADLVRARKHPAGLVTYIVDRNVNPASTPGARRGRRREP